MNDCSFCTKNHNVKMQCRAILCFVYGDPFALRVSYRIYIPLLPDNPSLIITLMAVNFVLILWYISCHVSKTKENINILLLLQRFEKLTCLRKLCVHMKFKLLFNRFLRLTRDKIRFITRGICSLQNIFYISMSLSLFFFFLLPQ